MMHSRRQCLSLMGTALCAGVLPACVTKSLFEDHRYTEEVSSILISQDEKFVAVITKDYHYLFNTTPSFLSALQDPLHKVIYSNSQTIFVDKNNVATLRCSLRVDPNASEADRALAKTAGFQAYENGVMNLQVELRGTRYRTNGVALQLNKTQKLNRTYQVSVNAEQSKSETAAKALLTPFTVTADGILVIAAVVGVIIFGFFIALYCLGQNSCSL